MNASLDQEGISAVSAKLMSASCRLSGRSNLILFVPISRLSPSTIFVGLVIDDVIVLLFLAVTSVYA